MLLSLLCLIDRYNDHDLVILRRHTVQVDHDLLVIAFSFAGQVIAHVTDGSGFVCQIVIVYQIISSCHSAVLQ